MRVVPTAGPPGWIRFGPSTRMDFLPAPDEASSHPFQAVPEEEEREEHEGGGRQPDKEGG